MSTNSLTGSQSSCNTAPLARKLGLSSSSLAGAGAKPTDAIVLTKFAHLPAKLESGMHVVQLVEEQAGNERNNNNNNNYNNKNDNYNNMTTSSNQEARSKLEGPLSNKLWSIGGQEFALASDERPQALDNAFSGDAGAQSLQREAFQIVWTDLSFRVDLSAYDKLLNGLLKATPAASLLKRAKRAAWGAPAQQRDATLEEAAAADNAKARAPASNKRIIFEKLNGHANSGEITAILGPSGAGKTSLLNALSGHTKNYGGQIKLLGGAPGHRMRLSIIPQKDYLIENLTVRENLLYSSRILNPSANFDHEGNILRVVRMLNLTACFHSIAANISGGEHKRVSIAQELLRQPDVLILDEPTSGLDSLNCKNLIRSLSALLRAAQSGRLQPMAIVMTIHQPDVDIFNMFHHVYCLARGGRVVYDGAPRDALQTLRSQAGLKGSCASLESGAGDELELEAPAAATTNPANLLIEIASEDIHGPEPIARLAKFHAKQFEQLARLGGGQCDSSASEMSKTSSSGSIVSQSSSGGGGTPPPTATTTTATATAAATTAPRARGLKRDKRLTAKHDHTGRFWYHARVLAARAFVATLRDPLMTLTSFLFHLSLPFVMYTVYPRRIGSVHACPVILRQLDLVSMADERPMERMAELQDELATTFECSTMFFLTAYALSMCSLTVSSLAFPLNMHILLKEVRNGWYNLPSYVLAKTLANFPFEVLLPVLSLVMIYLLLGMPSSPFEWRLVAIALVMALVSMISHTQGLIFGALCMDSVQTAIFLASASSLPQTLLSGFTARIKNLPLLYQKLSWLSQYRYSSDLINIIRFGHGTCPCDASTDEYLRTHKPQFGDVPNHLKPMLPYYLTNSNASAEADNSTATAVTAAPSNLTSLVTTTASSMVNATLQALATTTTTPTPAMSGQERVRIPGVEYELMLNETARSTMLKRLETEEVDLFGRVAEMTSRSFTYGRALGEGCPSVRSQLLVTAGAPADDQMPLMLGAMFALLLACKLILFLVVRAKIGARV